MKKLKVNLSPKAKKIINIVVDVICGIVLVIALIFAISMISSKRKNYGNYTELFGKAYLAVVSDSMSVDVNTGKAGIGNFKTGDLITIDILKDDEKNSLKVGDVITFRDNMIVNGQWRLNTHRIVSIEVNTDGTRSYITRGDKYSDNDPGAKTNNDIIGKLVGVKAGGGKIVSFMGSSAGFFVFVVLPTLIIVAIAASNLVVVILREKKSQKAVAEQAQQEVLADERERIRQELLAEMQIQNQTKTADEEKLAEAETTQTGKSVDESADGQTADAGSADGKKE